MKRIIENSDLEKLAEKISLEFKKDIEYDGFDNFEDMRRTYQWDSSDIKEEIMYMAINMFGKQLGFYSDLDDNLYDSNHELVPYRKLKSLVSKYLK